MDVLEPGQEFGAYRIIRRLDSGGMGIVYEADHIQLNRRCAIKVFSTASQQKEFLRRRFLAEGRMLAEFRHPRIVRVTDLAVDEASGVPYFAMDLVLSPDGKPRTLENARVEGVSEAEVAMWFKDVCEGLAYIHSKGVVHRDISLDNVMIGPDGHAVITDFGIARIFDDTLRRKVEITKFTMVEVGAKALRMGKDNYMAPELKREKMPAKASPMTDAWALGVLLFRLLTGFWFERDRRGNSLEMLAGYEMDWQSVVGRLLSECPGERLPEGGIGGVPGWLKPIEPDKPSTSRRGWFIAGLLALLAASVSFVAVRMTGNSSVFEQRETYFDITMTFDGDAEDLDEITAAVEYRGDRDRWKDIEEFLEECARDFLQENIDNRKASEVRGLLDDRKVFLHGFRDFVEHRIAEMLPEDRLDIEITGFYIFAGLAKSEPAPDTAAH